jgi:predicted dinucleotide-binding enzyme
VNVTIIGTGNMARAIGTRLLDGGHGVTVLGKETGDAEAVVKEIGEQAGGGRAQAGRSGESIADDVVVLAVYYPDARSFVEQHGDQLAGKTVVDISNPVNETYDGLVTPPDSSSPQELARIAPEGTKFVKAFNTTFGRTVVEGQVAGQPLDVFVAGDDAEAKATLMQLVEDGKLNPIDVGPLHRARELEAAGLLHMAVQEPLGTGFGSALKILA